MAILEGTYRGDQRGWLFGVGLSLSWLLGLGWNRSQLELRNGIARRFVLPPEPEANVIGIVVGGLAIGLGALALANGAGSSGATAFGLILVLLGAVIMAAALVENSSLRRRRAAWQHLLDQIDRTWICRRCGHQWSPASPAG